MRIVLAGFLALCGLSAGCGDAVSSEDAGTGSDAAAALGRLGLNDLSILYPLPTTFSQPGYLLASDVGARGELLPQSIYDTIPTFPVRVADGLEYARMRVVAIRFDTCGGSGDPCEPQIRLVMQPVSTDGSFRDSALHLFYAIEPDAVPALVTSLRALRAMAPEADPSGPLDVHPSLVAQGVEGAYGTALRELVLSHTGAENLVRMTFFLRAPPVVEVWFLGGFDIADGVATTMEIVGVGAGNQRVIHTELAGGGYDYELTPITDVPEDHAVMLSSEDATAADDATRQAAYRALLRVQNPDLHVVDALPCAGCHVASYITSRAATEHDLHADAFPEDAFQSDYDLTVRGGAASEPSSLRAFGYFYEVPMISHRTVNETAHALAYLEAHYPE